MRILLDENIPEGLLGPLRQLGHTVNSVGSLRLKGLDNGRLYRDVAWDYDLFFTKDREFAGQVTALERPGPVRVVLTTLPQQAEPGFVGAFVRAFRETDWTRVGTAVEWPSRS